MPSEAVSDLPALLRTIGDDTAFVVLTEEALHNADLKPLSEWILQQASWSDMPFLVLTQRGGGSERNPAAGRLSGILGNVSFIERPFHATSFISVAQTAMRGRRRQYEARARIEELREQERRLQTALEAAGSARGNWISSPTSCRLPQYARRSSADCRTNHLPTRHYRPASIPTILKARTKP